MDKIRMSISDKVISTIGLDSIYPLTPEYLGDSYPYYLEIECSEKEYTKTRTVYTLSKNAWLCILDDIQNWIDSMGYEIDWSDPYDVQDRGYDYRACERQAKKIRDKLGL